MPLSLLGGALPLKWLVAEQMLNAVFASHLFFLESEKSSDFFGLVKTSTNVGLRTSEMA